VIIGEKIFLVIFSGAPPTPKSHHYYSSLAEDEESDGKTIITATNHGTYATMITTLQLSM
jgi:hypothetical protein